MDATHELLAPMTKEAVRNTINNNRREIAAHTLWKKIEARDARIKRLESEAAWYRSRHQLLVREQKRFGDCKARTLLCDILANGQLLPDSDGTRYPSSA